MPLVGYDGRHILGCRSGNGRYVHKLFSHLTQEEDDFDYVLFSPSRTAGLPLVRRRNWRLSVPPVSFDFRGGRLSWQVFYLPSAACRAGVDLMHATAEGGCHRVRQPVKFVVTIHGMGYYIHKKFHSWKVRSMLYWLHKRAAARADQIITSSHNSKRDIMDLLNCPEDRVSVIYLGVDESFRPVADHERIKAVRARYQLPERFLLFVGNLEPRKNVVGLIEAFKLLKGRRRPDHKLVVAGRKAWLYGPIFERVIRLGLEKDILFTGFVPDEDLPVMYSLADVFVFPSLYEGFGLPPLEAMACGAPTVTTNVSSLPELVGDAAVCVSPGDTEEIADAIERLLENDDLRQQYARAGLERARRFRWEETARAVKEVYRKALEA